MCDRQPSFFHYFTVRKTIAILAVCGVYFSYIEILISMIDEIDKMNVCVILNGRDNE